MKNEPPKRLTGCCSCDGVEVKTTLPPQELITYFQQGLVYKLRARGIELTWHHFNANCELQVHVRQINEGNHVLRQTLGWIVPFLPPARVVIEGTVKPKGQNLQPFQYTAENGDGIFVKSVVQSCFDVLSQTLAYTIGEYMHKNESYF